MGTYCRYNSNPVAEAATKNMATIETNTLEAAKRRTQPSATPRTRASAEAPKMITYANPAYWPVGASDQRNPTGSATARNKSTVRQRQPNCTASAPDKATPISARWNTVAGFSGSKSGILFHQHIANLPLGLQLKPDIRTSRSIMHFGLAPAFSGISHQCRLQRLRADFAKPANCAKLPVPPAHAA